MYPILTRRLQVPRRANLLKPTRISRSCRNVRSQQILSRTSALSSSRRASDCRTLFANEITSEIADGHWSMSDQMHELQNGPDLMSSVQPWLHSGAEPDQCNNLRCKCHELLTNVKIKQQVYIIHSWIWKHKF